MSPIDAVDFGRRLQTLRQAASDLQRYRTTIDRSRLLRERDAQYMVLHALFVATQAAIDLALQVCADRGFANDGTYRDAFRALGENAGLDPELGRRLQGWASFRNVVAHFYPVIDYAKVHDALAEVGDLEAFAAWADAAARPEAR